MNIEKLKTKKTLLIVAAIVGCIVVIGILSFIFINKNKSNDTTGSTADKSSDPKTKDIAIPNLAKEYLPAFNLADNYKIKNDIIPLNEDGFALKEGRWVMIRDEYCENRNDVFCKFNTMVIADLLVNEEKKSIIKYFTITPENSDASQNFLSTYRSNLISSRSRNNLKCTGGMLINKDKTVFVYIDIDEGSDKDFTYKLLESVKETKQMDQFFRCDQLEQL